MAEVMKSDALKKKLFGKQNNHSNAGMLVRGNISSFVGYFSINRVSRSQVSGKNIQSIKRNS
jgi:hypothetical protein